MNAPDRIWLHPITEDDFQDVWFAAAEDGDVEYVRAHRAGWDGMDDLVKRLNEAASPPQNGGGGGSWERHKALLVEAAAVIARQEADLATAQDEVARLKAALAATGLWRGRRNV